MIFEQKCIGNISSIIFSKQNKVFYYTENYIIGFSLYGGFVQLILWSRSDIISTLDLSRGSSTGLAASPNLFVYFVFGVVMYKTCRYQNVCHSSNNFFACVFEPAMCTRFHYFEEYCSCMLKYVHDSGGCRRRKDKKRLRVICAF